MKYAIPILALLGFIAVCRADETTLPDLRKIYESRAAEIEAAFSNATTTSLQAYGAAIQQAREQYRKQGDLDGLLGATKELERFAKESSCPDTDPKDLSPLIATARAAYCATCAAAEQKKSEYLIELGKAYAARLEELEKQYVKQEEIETAVQVREEAERIKFILADLESHRPKQPAPKPPASADQTPQFRGRMTIARADFRVTSGKDRIAVLKPDALICGDRSSTFSSKYQGESAMPHKDLMGLKYVFRNSTYQMGPVMCVKSGLAYALTSHSGSSGQSAYLLENGFEREASLDTSIYAVFTRTFNRGETFSVPAKWAFLVF